MATYKMAEAPALSETITFYNQNTDCNAARNACVNGWPAIQIEASLKNRKQHVNALQCRTIMV